MVRRPKSSRSSRAAGVTSSVTPCPAAGTQSMSARCWANSIVVSDPPQLTTELATPFDIRKDSLALGNVMIGPLARRLAMSGSSTITLPSVDRASFFRHSRSDRSSRRSAASRNSSPEISNTGCSRWCSTSKSTDPLNPLKLTRTPTTPRSVLRSRDLRLSMSSTFALSLRHLHSMRYTSPALLASTSVCLGLAAPGLSRTSKCNCLKRSATTPSSPRPRRAGLLTFSSSSNRVLSDSLIIAPSSRMEAPLADQARTPHVRRRSACPTTGRRSAVPRWRRGESTMVGPTIMVGFERTARVVTEDRADE